MLCVIRSIVIPDIGIEFIPSGIIPKENPMARPAHYSPAIERQIVCALYHEAKRRRQPMTKLANELLSGVLRDTEGWQTAVDPAGATYGALPHIAVMLFNTPNRHARARPHSRAFSCLHPNPKTIHRETHIMAIKLSANYSKKLGLPEYSSHSFSASVEVELTDITQVEAECQKLYGLLQHSVDQEIQQERVRVLGGFGDRERWRDSGSLFLVLCSWKAKKQDAILCHFLSARRRGDDGDRGFSAL
jgi:hypothetical protein